MSTPFDHRFLDVLSNELTVYHCVQHESCTTFAVDVGDGYSYDFHAVPALLYEIVKVLHTREDQVWDLIRKTGPNA